MKRKIWSEEEVRYIISMYEQRHSIESISKKLNVSPYRISNILHESNTHIRTNAEQAQKFSANELFFENIDTERKAYWLGFMYADGFIVTKRNTDSQQIGITLTSSDKLHLEKFKQDIQFTGKINTYVPKRTSESSYHTSPYSRVLITSNKLASDLKKQGCLEQKTFLSKFPTQEQVPEHLVRHFIRGYVDGNGSVLEKRNSKRDTYIKQIALSVTGTKEMCEGVLLHFNLAHLKLGQRFPKRNNNNYCLTIGGNKQALSVLGCLYDDSSVYLERKYDKYMKAKRHYEEYLSRAC